MEALAAHVNMFVHFRSHDGNLCSIDTCKHIWEASQIVETCFDVPLTGLIGVKLYDNLYLPDKHGNSKYTQ